MQSGEGQTLEFPEKKGNLPPYKKGLPEREALSPTALELSGPGLERVVLELLPGLVEPHALFLGWRRKRQRV